MFGWAGGVFSELDLEIFEFDFCFEESDFERRFRIEEVAALAFIFAFCLFASYLSTKILTTYTARLQQNERNRVMYKLYLPNVARRKQFKF